MGNTIKIYKSKQAEELDETFSGSPDALRALYATALRHYEQYEAEPLSALVSDLAGLPGIPWNEQVAEHFANGWAPGNKEHEPREVILRNGYREAFQLALERGLPVETFWVTGAGDDFEVHVSDGVNHVTVFMIVPGDDYPAGSFRAFAKSWVVAAAGGRAPAGGRRAAEPFGTGDVVKIEVSGSAESAE
jgi:hypothetical protein